MAIYPQTKKTLVDKDKTEVFASVCPTLLAWRDSFRTFDWVKALPVPELVIRNVRQLLALI